MRLAHGFKFRKRDWSIIAYFRGTVIAEADLRPIALHEHAAEIFRAHVARLLINFGLHPKDAYRFASRPFRNIPKLSNKSGVLH